MKFGLCKETSLFAVFYQVQNRIGAKSAVGFDITAACSGFVVSLNTAAQFIKSGAYNNVLVIGADALSRVVNWKDRCESDDHITFTRHVVCAANNCSTSADQEKGSLIRNTYPLNAELWIILP